MWTKNDPIRAHPEISTFLICIPRKFEKRKLRKLKDLGMGTKKWMPSCRTQEWPKSVVPVSNLTSHSSMFVHTVAITCRSPHSLVPVDSIATVLIGIIQRSRIELHCLGACQRYNFPGDLIPFEHRLNFLFRLCIFFAIHAIHSCLIIPRCS